MHEVLYEVRSENEVIFLPWDRKNRNDTLYTVHFIHTFRVSLLTSTVDQNGSFNCLSVAITFSSSIIDAVASFTVQAVEPESIIPLTWNVLFQ